nr:Site-specific recombinase and resolvase superfamily protein [Rhizobium sp. Q54]
MRDAEVAKQYNSGSTNRVNATHRPQYLLSRLLECAERGGPFAISRKDRYSCTNRKKRLSIKDLGGAYCGNSKTITPHKLEERVLNCILAPFYGLEIFERVSNTMIRHEIAMLKKGPLVG